MAIQVQGNGGTTVEADATFRAMRASLRPEECINWNAIGATSGAMTGVAANGPVFSFRNTGTNLILIHRLQVGFVTTTAFTTAQALSYAVYRATGFTVSDSGGTALYTAGQNKYRTSFTNISSAPDIRIGSTGAVTAGTRTLDTVALGIAGGSSTAVGTSLQPTGLITHDAGDYPVVLAQNEGLVMTNLIAMGAAGVINLHVNIEFSENSSY